MFTVREHDERRCGGYLYVYVIAPDAAVIGPLTRVHKCFMGRSERGVGLARKRAKALADHLNK